MTEFRKRKSSTSVNGVGSFSNQQEFRENKSKTLQMQQQLSLSKRMVMFQSELRNPQKEQQSHVLGGNMLTSIQNSIGNQKQSVIKQQKHEIDGKYNTSNQNIPQSMSNPQIESETNKKGIFEEYQERWNQNNKKIFRFLITWKVGDDGKIEDQLKLMITYLSIIFIIILFICGFATTYYFHTTNKQNIQESIESQVISINLYKKAKTILQNSLGQYKNSTEYIFKGYEFVLNYLNDLILSKLEISYKIYDFDYIKQFPYKGPNRMRNNKVDNQSICPIYTGNVQFSTSPVSLKCIDYYEFDPLTKPLLNDYVYQEIISADKMNGAVDILNYILESQIFDVFVTKIYKIYFGFENRQAMYSYPGLMMKVVPDSYRVHSRSWYSNTRQFHLQDPKSTDVFRVISTPYFDAGTNERVITISKAILAPAIEDTDKRYLVGKGRFMGVASIDIIIGEFQQLFQEIQFYETGYLLITNIEGNLLNEPDQFIAQITDKDQQGQTYEELEIQQLISQAEWDSITQSQEDQKLTVVKSKQGLDLVITSTVNRQDYYQGEEIVILLIIPYSEVYGEIDKQNQSNLENIIVSSIVSLVVFIIATIICMIFVKKKIVHMVSAISELNKCALSLTSGNNNSNSAENLVGQENTNQKREVMQKLNQIQKNSQSETIKELVKGFENQLKGISKLGMGGQNILQNGKSNLKYEQAEYGGTQLPSYIEPLLNYLNVKREKFDSEPSFQLSQYSSLSQMQIKTLTNQNRKMYNTSYPQQSQLPLIQQQLLQQQQQQTQQQQKQQQEKQTNSLDDSTPKQANKNTNIIPNSDQVDQIELNLVNPADIANQIISDRNIILSNNNLLSNRSEQNEFMFSNSTKNNDIKFILNPLSNDNEQAISKDNQIINNIDGFEQNENLIVFGQNENDTIDLDSIHIQNNIETPPKNVK